MSDERNLIFFNEVLNMFLVVKKYINMVNILSIFGMEVDVNEFVMKMR